MPLQALSHVLWTHARQCPSTSFLSATCSRLAFFLPASPWNLGSSRWGVILGAQHPTGCWVVTSVFCECGIYTSVNLALRCSVDPSACSWEESPAGPWLESPEPSEQLWETSCRVFLSMNRTSPLAWVLISVLHGSLKIFCMQVTPGLGFIPLYLQYFKNETLRGFPGGAVVESLPADAGDTGSSPGLGRSHMPRSN